MAKTSEAQLRAARKYELANLSAVRFTLNRKTEADIIDHLESIDEPRATYIKRLIREDMEKSN